MGRGRRVWNKDWCTSSEHLESVRRVFGGRIALDPCSSTWSRGTADVEWLPPDSDGLLEDWDHATVFVHPPYAGRTGPTIDPWLAKCSDASRRHLAQIVALAPTDPNSEAWQRDVWRSARAVCFIFSPRIRFAEDGRLMRRGILASYAFVYWGHAYERFEREFRRYGAVVDLLVVRLPGPAADDPFNILAPPSATPQLGKGRRAIIRSIRPLDGYDKE